MKSHDLTRLGGLAAVVGGVVILFCDVLGLLLFDFDAAFSEVASTGAWIPWSLAYLSGLVLVLCGLVALYVHQSEAAGVFGLIAFLLAFTGTAIVVGGFWDNAFLMPSLAIEAPEFLDAETVSGPADFGFLLGNILCFGGLALFGLSALRAGVYPRLASILFAAGAAIAFLPLPALTIVLDIALIWFGLSLLGNVRPENRTSPPARNRASVNDPEPARPS